MILNKVSPDKREFTTWVLFFVAQISMATSGILEHFYNDQVPFLTGILSGFSMVGNLFFLTQVRHLKKPFCKK